jgi:hypothetical protein
MQITLLWHLLRNVNVLIYKKKIKQTKSKITFLVICGNTEGLQDTRP